MVGTRFTIEKAYLGGVTDVAYYREDEDPLEMLKAQAIEALGTDLMIRVAGVTMHLAAWLDPEHWEEDWREAMAEELGDDEGDVADFIAGLLAEAKEEG